MRFNIRYENVESMKHIIFLIFILLYISNLISQDAISFRLDSSISCNEDFYNQNDTSDYLTLHTSYRYDNQNRLTSKNSELLSEKYIYYNDSTVEFIEYKSFNSQNSIKEKVLKKFNNNKIKFSTLQRINSNNIYTNVKKTVYFYDENMNDTLIVDSIWKDNKWKFSQKSLKQFDQFQNLVYYRDNTQSIYYEYDQKNRKISEIVTYSSGWELPEYFKTTWHYSNSNNLDSIKYYKSIDPTPEYWKCNRKKVYHYDTADIVRLEYWEPYENYLKLNSYELIYKGNIAISENIDSVISYRFKTDGTSEIFAKRIIQFLKLHDFSYYFQDEENVYTKDGEKHLVSKIQNWYNLLNSSVTHDQYKIPKFNIYPQPVFATEELSIESEINFIKMSFEIVDVSGRIIMTCDSANFYAPQLPGIYFVKIKDHSKILGITKLIVTGK